MKAILEDLADSSRMSFHCHRFYRNNQKSILLNFGSKNIENYDYHLDIVVCKFRSFDLIDEYSLLNSIIKSL